MSLSKKLQEYSLKTSLSAKNLSDLAYSSIELSSEKALLVLSHHKKDSKKLISAFSYFFPEKNLFYLEKFNAQPYRNQHPDLENIHQQLYFLDKALQCSNKDIFICDLESLIQKTIPVKLFQEKHYLIRKGDHLNLSKLRDLGYQEKELVEKKGDFSLRGHLLDIFSPNQKDPVRIELFGDQVESLKYFDLFSQRTKLPLNSLKVILPSLSLFLKENTEKALCELQKRLSQSKMSPEEKKNYLGQIRKKEFFGHKNFFISDFYSETSFIFDYFKKPVNFLFYEKNSLLEIEKTFLESLKEDEKQQSFFYPPVENIYSSLNQIEIPEKDEVFHYELLTKNLSHSFNHLSFKALGEYEKNKKIKNLFDSWIAKNFKIILSAPRNTKQIRLKSKLSALGYKFKEKKCFSEIKEEEKENVFFVKKQLEDSFVSEKDRKVFLQTELFFKNELNKGETSSSKRFQKKLRLLSFSSLEKGDYLVHLVHGIGVFLGLKKIKLAQSETEFIVIEYKNKDILYVPSYGMNCIHKYQGIKKENLIQKLGSSSWAQTKIKVKKQITDIAYELIEMNAKRKLLKKTPLLEEDETYYRFEEEFEFEETLDQKKACMDVLNDLKKDTLVDRLICGDVGFGKTEVIMRACFRSCQNQGQVAVMAPTTVLSFQLYRKFKKRFKNTPFNIEVINRFVSKKQISQILEKTKKGETHILIGTKRILSSDVHFKNLQMLIVDEEHKFGVKDKEKIKQIKKDIDTFSLSATPIPRTLNLSLLNLKQMSFIATPPQRRLPVKTFLIHKNKKDLKRIIEDELKRKGQVFFLHNQIKTIAKKQKELQEICPEAKIGLAHGRMESKDLEKTMLCFIRGEIDVLVCTTLIESGTDIPRANTMIIDQAHHLGLSQLHQLRGRVGRGEHQAYCYLLSPPHLEKKDKDKLSVILNCNSLEGGLKIAQYDLELRGAGEILGESQSGHIQSVGYELYLNLLEEEISQIQNKKSKQKIEVEISINESYFIPDTYIKDMRARLFYYKALSEVQSDEEIEEIKLELFDIFGPLPEPVLKLLETSSLKIICKKLLIFSLKSFSNTFHIKIKADSCLSTEKILQLIEKEKYQLTKDFLKIKVDEISLENIKKELEFLEDYSKNQT